MLKSRILINLGLLALVVVLGLANYTLRYQDDTTDQRLSTLDAEQIDSIEIAHRDRYVVLKKSDDGWRMTRPINIPANNFRISSLLKLIDATPHASYDVSQLELAQFQLQQPRTTLRLSNGKQDVLFEFGTTNPLNRLRYVRVGQAMHLIDDNIYPLISSQIGTLISPRLLPDVETLNALQLPEISLRRDGEGRWQLSPDSSKLSADDIQAVIDAWLHAEAFGVHDYLHREQLGTVEISAMHGETVRPFRFLITDTEPWLILARPELGIEYHLNSEVYDRLLRPGHLQDKAILDAEQAQFEQ